MALGRVVVVGGERLAHVARRRAGERDQAFGPALLEPAPVELGAAAVLVAKPGTRQQLAQAQVAGARAAQEEEPLGLVAVAGILYPAVSADDRLHARAARGAIELDQPEQVREIGERERRHAVARRALHRLVEAHDTVGHRVLAVQPEVDEARRRHLKKILPLKRPYHARAMHPATWKRAP